MNAIILTAIWGVMMMLGGAFIKSKSYAQVPGNFWIDSVYLLLIVYR